MQVAQIRAPCRREAAGKPWGFVPSFMGTPQATNASKGPRHHSGHFYSEPRSNNLGGILGTLELVQSSAGKCGSLILMEGSKSKASSEHRSWTPQGAVGLWDLFLQLRTTFIKDNWRSQGHDSAQLIRAILNKSLILKATRTFLVPPQFTGSWIRVWIQIQEAICCSCCLPAGIHCEALEFEQPPPLLPFHQQPLQGHKAGIHPRKATSVYKCKADEGTEKSAWMLK